MQHQVYDESLFHLKPSDLSCDGVIDDGEMPCLETRTGQTKKIFNRPNARKKTSSPNAKSQKPRGNKRKRNEVKGTRNGMP